MIGTEEEKLKILKLCTSVLLSLIMLTSFVSCKTTASTNSETVEVIYHTVTFETNGGSVTQSARVLNAGKVNEPTAPTKDGFIFDCWLYNGTEWDFSYDTVSSDITLTAMWIDAATVYSYTPVEGGVCITGIKRSFELMQIPSVLNGISVVAIGEAVFADTNSETTIKIVVPASVKSVGKNAFRSCTDIEITVLGELSEVGELAFLDCNKLTKISLAEGLTAILPQAFNGCTSLQEIILPNSVASVGENAFEDCTALKSVKLSSSVKQIDDGAFLGCDALEAVYFSGTEAEFGNIAIANGNNEFKSARLYTEG